MQGVVNPGVWDVEISWSRPVRSGERFVSLLFGTGKKVPITEG